MIVAAPSRPLASDLEVDLLSQSLTLRTALRRAINAAGSGLSLSVTGAHGGDGALRKRAMVVDADMPGLTGVALFEHIASAGAEMPVVVVACDTPRGRGLQKQALRAGATAFFVIPETFQPRDLKDMAARIVVALRGGDKGEGEPARSTCAATTSSTSASQRSTTEAQPPKIPRRQSFVKPQVLVVGSSTGGPQALLSLFKDFKPHNITFPVLIVQHMPAAFTSILAEHITRATGWQALEAKDGEPLTPGEIRIAPGGKHLLVAGSKNQLKLGLSEDPPVNFCRPAADVLFMSAAALFRGSVLGVVLTGMGQDGANGARTIKDAGGYVIAQDQESSVVWGMPGAAVATGAVDQVLPLNDIGSALSRAATGVL